MENSKYLSIKEEAFLAASNGVKYMKDVSEHGLFGALYEIAEVIGRGVSVNLRDIPVKQVYMVVFRLRQRLKGLAG